MKTEFAKEKSEYSHLLVKCINNLLSEEIRQKAMLRIAEIESKIKKQGDEITIIVATKNSNIMEHAGIPMSMENIKNG